MPFPKGLRHTRRFQGGLQEKQILRQGGLPVQKFSGPRVLQSQQLGVQGLPAEGGRVPSWPSAPSWPALVLKCGP